MNLTDGKHVLPPHILFSFWFVDSHQYTAQSYHTNDPDFIIHTVLGLDLWFCPMRFSLSVSKTVGTRAYHLALLVETASMGSLSSVSYLLVSL